MNMSRRRRSGIAETPEEAKKMSQAKFESEIARCKWGFENGGHLKGEKLISKGLYGLRSNVRNYSEFLPQCENLDRDEKMLNSMFNTSLHTHAYGVGELGR